MLSRRASETESTQVQERVERANAPPGEHSMASLPDPGEWNADTAASNDAGYPQEEEQEGAYYDQEEGQYDDQHPCHDDGDDGQYYNDVDGQYQYEDDAEYQQEQEQHYEYDEDAPPYEEDIPAPEPKQQRGVRFRSVLKQEKQSSDTSKKQGRKQISAYNLFGLSRVSAAYDSGNKGYLTAAEQKLREMDKANVGSLNNAQVAQLMEQKLREDEIIKRQRRLLYVLGCMTVLLMVSNLGTAWAAAILAKDTAVDMASGELRINGGGGDGEGSRSAVVVTRAMGDSFLFYNFNASSTVLMNHHLESEEVEEEEGDSMVPIGTGTTGTVGGGDNSAIADAEGDASTTSDLLVPGAEDEEEEVDDDDSLFCISPKQAAKLWHETSTGTSVTAFFDYSPPTTDADASPPPEVHSLTLNADGALMNATHACLHTGLPSDAAGPQYVCIDFANTNCDVEISRQQQEASDGAALSGANDGTSSSDQRAAASQSPNVFHDNDVSHNSGEDHPDHVHGRRVLFETALQEIRDPNSALVAPQSPFLRRKNPRGTSETSSTLTRRTRRKRNKNTNNNPNPKRKNKRRKPTKKIFDMEIPADMCIMIPMATDAAVHRPIPGGPPQVAPATPAEVMGDYMDIYHGNDSF